MKRVKRMAAIFISLLIMVTAAIPAFAAEVTPPPSTERADIFLNVYDLTNPDAAEPAGDIIVTGQSGDFCSPGDYYRLQAVPKEGYQFDHWEANLTATANDGTIFDLKDSYLGIGGYPFGEGEVLYDPYASQIQVNSILAAGHEYYELHYAYTVNAVFRPMEEDDTVTVPVSYSYKGETIGSADLTLTLTEGEHVILPAKEEFQPLGFICEDAGQTVTVSRGSDGRLHAQPESILFNVAPSVDPTTITFHLNFVTRDGTVVSQADVPFEDIGTYPFIKYTLIEEPHSYSYEHTIPVPQGYQREERFPDHASLLYVDGSWQAVPATQDILVTKCAQVTVHFVLEDSTPLSELSYQKYIHEGKSSITPVVPDGYEWVGGEPIVVQSYRDNDWNLIADPTDITFTLKKLPQAGGNPGQNSQEEPDVPSPPTNGTSPLLPAALLVTTGAFSLLLILVQKRNVFHRSMH